MQLFTVGRFLSLSAFGMTEYLLCEKQRAVREPPLRFIRVIITAYAILHRLYLFRMTGVGDGLPVPFQWRSGNGRGWNPAPTGQAQTTICVGDDAHIVPVFREAERLFALPAFSRGGHSHQVGNFVKIASKGEAATGGGAPPLQVLQKTD